MTGKKDFKPVKRNGKQMHMQERLILGNLKEIYSQFKSDCPEVKTGFSKFCKLRPKYCILARAS
jgi:hypothetical protein